MRKALGTLVLIGLATAAGLFIYRKLQEAGNGDDVWGKVTSIDTGGYPVGESADLS
jgi:hypothetical protein